MADQLVHICEVCGTEKTMTPQEAFDEGWDYPPGIGAYGVVSPRTCGNCTIEKTLWWRVAIEKIDLNDLPESDLATLARIQGEPESITPKGT